MYIADEKRYETMKYNRCGKSGLLLPAVSLGLWHNFGSNGNFDGQISSRYSRGQPYPHGRKIFEGKCSNRRDACEGKEAGRTGFPEGTVSGADGACLDSSGQRYYQCADWCLQTFPDSGQYRYDWKPFLQ